MFCYQPGCFVISQDVLLSKAKNIFKVINDLLVLLCSLRLKVSNAHIFLRIDTTTENKKELMATLQNLHRLDCFKF